MFDHFFCVLLRLIGDNTLIGTIAHLASQTTGEMTPIQKEIHSFVIRLTIFSVIMGIIFFVIGAARGNIYVNHMYLYRVAL